jgi:cob(I)alamin adenosyltransferase
MKIYTKTGDKGETGLFGGDRVLKSSIRIEAYGTIDELNSFIGLAVIDIKTEEIRSLLQDIQNDLFTLGSDLAAPDNEKTQKMMIKRVSEVMYLKLEQEIDRFEEELKPLKNFILPGGTRGASLLHICRTVCRRAERLATALKSAEGINENIIIYLNRLSDLMFVLSRYENSRSGVPDIKWRST